jgi:hypothetical protein
VLAIHGQHAFALAASIALTNVCRTAQSDLREQWPFRLVATATTMRLNHLRSFEQSLVPPTPA